jgi:hypothetical protein
MRSRRARRLGDGAVPSEPSDGWAKPPSALASPGRAPKRLSVAALVFLRGRDADGRLRELCAGAAAARPVLGALAAELCGRKLHEAEARERAVAQAVFVWQPLRRAAPHPALAALAAGASDCSAQEIDHRLRAAIAFLQGVDLEVGRVLGQVQRRALYRELGFASFERYVVERLDLAPRTARRLAAIARSEPRAPALATAFRAGEVHALQAVAILPAVEVQPGTGLAWVERARSVSLRRLEDDVAEAAAAGSAHGHGPAARAAIAFRAPPEVAALFLAMLARTELPFEPFLSQVGAPRSDSIVTG